MLIIKGCWTKVYESDLRVLHIPHILFLINTNMQKCNGILKFHAILPHPHTFTRSYFVSHPESMKRIFSGFKSVCVNRYLCKTNKDKKRYICKNNKYKAADPPLEVHKDQAISPDTGMFATTHMVYKMDKDKLSNSLHLRQPCGLLTCDCLDELIGNVLSLM